jgi:hypothetical protein
MKFYVSQKLPNYQQIANAVAARFPHLRVAIGPHGLNEHHSGADTQEIEDFIASFVRGDVGIISDSPMSSPAEASPSSLARGEFVWVLLPGIGAVEAQFIRALGDDKIVIDLDGVEETVETKMLVPPPDADVVPPEPPKADVVPPEPPKADVVPPEPPKADVVPPEPPKADVAPS